MTIKEFNLLQIEVYENEIKIYEGMCENVPEDLKERQIKVLGIEGKIVKVNLI